MLDKCLLNDFEHLVRSAAYIREIVQYLSELIELKVSVKALIDELLFYKFPKFVILERHHGGSLDKVIQGFRAVAVQGRQLLLHGGQEQVPKVVVSLKLVLSNHPEGVGDLEIGHMLPVLLEDEGEGVGGLGAREGEVDLVEDEAPVVIEVVIATSMYHADGRLNKAESGGAQ